MIDNLDLLKKELIKVYNTTNDTIHIIDTYSFIIKYNGVDWKKYININKEKYNRHVFYTCDEFDIIIITWAPGQFSPIHNHPSNGCFVKILHGEIMETKYNINTLEKTSEYLRQTDNISYIDDTQTYHKMHNICQKTHCVSLHIYSPGNHKPTFFNENI